MKPPFAAACICALVAFTVIEKNWLRLRHLKDNDVQYARDNNGFDGIVLIGEVTRPSHAYVPSITAYTSIYPCSFSAYNNMSSKQILFVLRDCGILHKRNPFYVYSLIDGIELKINEIRSVFPTARILIDSDGPSYEMQDFSDIFVYVALRNIILKYGLSWPQFPTDCAIRNELGCSFSEFRTPNIVPEASPNAPFNFPLHETCFHLLDSRKYSPICFPKPKQLYPVLITGAGGSGSHAVALILRNLGIRVHHERLDIEGSVVSLSNLHVATNE